MKLPPPLLRIMDFLYPIKQDEKTALFGYSRANKNPDPLSFKYKNRTEAARVRNSDLNVFEEANQIQISGTVYRIPQKSEYELLTYDIARSDCERDIHFDPEMIYAVVRASYYGGKGYTTHKTEVSAIAASKRETNSDCAYDIIDRTGTRYEIKDSEGTKHLVPVIGETPCLSEYEKCLTEAEEEYKNNFRTTEIRVHVLAHKLAHITAKYAHKTAREIVSDLICAAAKKHIIVRK